MYRDLLYSCPCWINDWSWVREPQVKQTYTVVSPLYTKEPAYTIDEGCTCLGKLNIDVPDIKRNWSRNHCPNDVQWNWNDCHSGWKDNLKNKNASHVKFCHKLGLI